MWVNRVDGLALCLYAGAKNLPFVNLLKDGRYKPAPELQAAFNAAGLDLCKPIVGSCGSGLTACILALAAYQLTGKVVSQLFVTAVTRTLDYRAWIAEWLNACVLHVEPVIEGCSLHLGENAVRPSP